MEVHVLAGCVETGFDSGLEDPCGRLAGFWSELSCLAFRDSWCVSETTTADAGAGPAEELEAAALSPLSLLSAETLAGSERHRLRQNVRRGCYISSGRNGRVHDDSGSGNPNVGGFSRHLRDWASRAI